MLRKTQIFAGLTAVGLLLSANISSSQAAFISEDSSFGAGTITRDTDTGLEWLDLTESTGLSFNQVQAQFGAGGTYEGFSYATRGQLETLFFDSAGITPGLQAPAEMAVWDLANLLGITDAFFFVSFGHFMLDGAALNAGLATLVPFFPVGDAAGSRAVIEDNGLAFTDSEPTVGSFLIRVTSPTNMPVPEPGSAFLLLSGLAILAYARRRKFAAL